MCFIVLNESLINKTEGTWLFPIGSLSANYPAGWWWVLAGPTCQAQRDSRARLQAMLWDKPSTFPISWIPLFINVEMEIQRGQLTHSRSHSKKERGTEFEHTYTSVPWAATLTLGPAAAFSSLGEPCGEGDGC